VSRGLKTGLNNLLEVNDVLINQTDRLPVAQTLSPPETESAPNGAFLVSVKVIFTLSLVEHGKRRVIWYGF